MKAVAIGVMLATVQPRFSPDGSRIVFISDRDGADNVYVTDYAGGFTYFVDDHVAKVQVNYMRKTFDNSAVAARNIFLINAQAAW